jgi:hypothetical protein
MEALNPNTDRIFKVRHCYYKDDLVIRMTVCKKYLNNVFTGVVTTYLSLIKLSFEEDNISMKNILVQKLNEYGMDLFYDSKKDFWYLFTFLGIIFLKLDVTKPGFKILKIVDTLRSQKINGLGILEEKKINLRKLVYIDYCPESDRIYYFSSKPLIHSLQSSCLQIFKLSTLEMITSADNDFKNLNIDLKKLLRITPMINIDFKCSFKIFITDKNTLYIAGRTDLLAPTIIYKFNMNGLGTSDQSHKLLPSEYISQNFKKINTNEWADGSHKILIDTNPGLKVNNQDIINIKSDKIIECGSFKRQLENNKPVVEDSFLPGSGTDSFMFKNILLHFKLVYSETSSDVLTQKFYKIM